MNTKMVIAVVLTDAALTGILLTTTIAAYADESETETEQKLKQKNVENGESINTNCDANFIDTFEDEGLCGGLLVH